MIPHSIMIVLGWLAYCFCGYAAFLVAWTIWKRESPKHAARWMRFLVRIRKAKDKAKGYTKFAEVMFVAVVSVALMFVATRPSPISYACPESCLGIVKIESSNAIETVNLKTGQHREWRLHANPPVQRGSIFPGYVIELRVVEMVGFQALDEPAADPPYHIVRGKDLKRPAYFPASVVTQYDGEDRPVLAKNCHNTADDSDVICEGGDARFDTELSQR